MISEYLQSTLRCPVCLAEQSTKDEADRRLLEREDGRLRCLVCHREYALVAERGFADLRPPAGTFQDLTDYADEAFHERPGPIRPLFLSARVKMNMMRRMLRPGAADALLDIGCGKGRFLYFQHDRAKHTVGIDAGAHFGAEPVATVDLTRGDVRQLPFASGSFDKAFSLDVLEHLDEPGVRQMLAEARRVLKPGGELFVYSHVMMSSKLAAFQRGINRLVQWLDRRGLVDNEPERHRKSDHRNVLRSYDQLHAVLEDVGFRIEAIRYYNVFFKAIVEDLMLPLAEHNIFRRAKTHSTDDGGPAAAHEPTELDPHHDGDNHGDHPGDDDHHRSLRPEVGKWAHGPLTLASYLLELDIILFSRVRTGPFFVLLKAV